MVDYHRHSIRLKGYDYSQAGYYFVTICVQDREWLFGKIEHGEMKLNDAGKMVEYWWGEIGNKFKPTRLAEYTIMPNHLHGIVINNLFYGVGADRCVCPNQTKHNNQGAHTGAPLPHIIRWFKTMTTNQFLKNIQTNNWPSFNKRLWQRNYYEHIIRHEKEYQAIRQYIQDNPKNWEKDDLFIEHTVEQSVYFRF
jgi:REP element-mobilizing transposase RayT